MMAACVTDRKYLSRESMTFKSEFEPEPDTNPRCGKNFPGSNLLRFCGFPLDSTRCLQVKLASLGVFRTK